MITALILSPFVAALAVLSWLRRRVDRRQMVTAPAPARIATVKPVRVAVRTSIQSEPFACDNGVMTETDQEAG